MLRYPILLALAVLLLACAFRRAAAQEMEARNKALLAIERLQGEVHSLPARGGKAAFAVSFANNLDVTEGELGFLASLPGLEILNLNNTLTGDRTLQSLKNAAG